MPQLTFWAWAIWLTGMAAQALLLLWAIRLRLWRSMPSILFYLLLRNTTSLVLLAITLADASWTPAAYFYFYWAAQVVACFTRVWIITELGCAACVADEMLCRFLRRVIPGLSVLVFFVACVVMAGEPHVYPAAFLIPEVLTTVTVSRVLPLTVLAAFLVFGIAQRTFGIRWTARETMFAFGLFVQMVSEFAVSWLLGLIGKVHMLSNLQGLLYFFSLVLWFSAFAQDDEYLISIADLSRISGPFLTVGKQLREQR